MAQLSLTLNSSDARRKWKVGGEVLGLLRVYLISGLFLDGVSRWGRHPKTLVQFQYVARRNGNRMFRGESASIWHFVINFLSISLRKIHMYRSTDGPSPRIQILSRGSVEMTDGQEEIRDTGASRKQKGRRATG